MKGKKIIVLTAIILVSIIISYFMFTSGVTSKLLGEISGVFKEKTRYTSDLPVITFVSNSSGEKLVNNDVNITVDVKSSSKVTKVLYSVDKNNWFKADIDEADNKVIARITFSNTMDSTVYIKAENQDGYESYYYETKVMIDKEKPSIKVSNTPVATLINLSDNQGLSYLQYSDDKLNWENEELQGQTMMSINKVNLDFSYVRAVDKAGNISKIIKIR